jgi:hypothetical protein
MDALVLLSGDDFGFDPWDEQGTGPNQEALAQWRRWVEAR